MTDPVSLEQLARDWKTFKDRYGRPASLLTDTYEPASLEVIPRCLADPSEVRAAIADFAGEQGWLTLLDRHVMLEKLPPAGTILNGELCKQGESLHIRHQGARWQLTRYVESAGAPTHLACDRRIASRIGERAVLAYRVYFQATPDRGTLPMVARFTGFMEE